MNRCQRCEAELPSGARFCPACGHAVAVPPSPPEAADPTTIDGRYEVRRRLGRGGSKLVYLAYDTRLQREVAVAVVRPVDRDDGLRLRLQREAQAMARLGDHPNIVTVYDFAEADGAVYIVSQYMSGGDLAARLKQQPEHRLAIDEALRVAADVCTALDHAHQRGVVHRDVKPGNIWLAADGTAKLGDFGLASTDGDARATPSTAMLGTAAYMPPEQALGRGVEQASDLYALGATLYELLCGRPPFLGDDVVAVISQHLNAAPVAPTWHNPAVPGELSALTMRLLAKDPAERPHGAGVVAGQLRDLLVRQAGNAVTPSPETKLNPLDRLAGGVFVGRERAMRSLRAALESALAGHGNLLLLVGEPGIGKTRTADELATYARLRAARVLVGRGYEGEGAPAYWPWVQVLRGALQDPTGADVLAELGAAAGDLVQVVPELRDTIGELPAAADPDQARFRLFDSIAKFLRRLAEREALVIVLDDLHWHDRPSLLLLRFLARELREARILMLGTYRDVELRRQHPLTQSLAELAREGAGERIVLRGLSERDVARFIEVASGRSAPPSLVAAVHRETEGNPFFVSEVVRLLVSEGRLEHAADDGAILLTIPQSVREVIGRRLDQLSERSNRVLTWAAVIGREFSLPILERVLSAERGEAVRREALLEALEEAVQARIIAASSGAVGRYSFTHALMRETLYGELSTTRRIRAHRTVGRVLEKAYAGAADQHLAELAYHFAEAAAGGDVERAISYAQQAGDRAQRLLAYEEAVTHFERMLQLFELLPARSSRRPLRRSRSDAPHARRRKPTASKRPDYDTRLCEGLLALGGALRRAGDFIKAREVFARAAGVARELEGDDGAHFANAALGFAEEGIQAGRVDHHAIELLREALEAVPPADSEIRSLLLSRLANQLYWSAERQHVVRLTDEAADMARRIGAPTALARAVGVRQFALWDPQDADQLRAVGDEIVGYAMPSGDRGLEALGREWRLAAFMQVGDVAGADAEIAAYLGIVTELRLPMQEWLGLNWQAMRAILDGRFLEAEDFSSRALAVGQRLRTDDSVQAHAVQMLVIRSFLGRIGELEPLIRPFIAQYPTLLAWRCGLAFLLIELGRLDEGRVEFERLAANEFEDFPQDILSLAGLAMLTFVCAALDDKPRAASLYKLLLPYAGRTVMISAGLLCLGSASRYLGLLAAIQERWDEAASHFEDAVAMHARMGAGPFLASTQSDYAAMLLRRGRPQDRQRAFELASSSLELSTALGMTPDIARATALKVEAQGVSTTDFSTSIDTVAARVQRERPDLERCVAPNGTTTLMFSDMEGFTQMTERLGDEAAHKVIRVHNAVVRQAVARNGGVELELQGDGFLLAFRDPPAALRCALEIQHDLAAYSAEHPEQPIRVRIGLHTGEAIRDTDKFFGKTVIVAARVAAQAKGGEILVSSALREVLDGEPGAGLRFGPTRDAELKGLAGRYALHPVEWATSAAVQ